MTRYFITGGAGFIGSNLVDRLLLLGHAVTVYDNLSTGQVRFLEDAQRQPLFSLVQGDLLDNATLNGAMAGHDVVFHLAANADVRFGLDHPDKDLQQNTIGTFNVLEAMRKQNVKAIGFSSTGSVYGEPTVFPTPEDCPFPVQTSLYAASKLAGESLIQAYATGFGIRACIFRFVSILGDRYSHGHVYDFYAKLMANPHSIDVLGNGQQRKSYLHIQDCIDAILLAMDATTQGARILNLGTDEHCTVDDSLGWICQELGVNPERKYSGGNRGWVGDSPFIFLDASRIKSLGWRAKYTIHDAVVATLRYLQQNRWLFERRA